MVNHDSGCDGPPTSQFSISAGRRERANPDPELRRGVHLVTGDNPDDWRGYGGRPLWFAAAPDSLLSDYLQDSIQVQLDHEIGSQAEDGGWHPNWSWGQYESVWETARVEWAGT